MAIDILAPLVLVVVGYAYARRCLTLANSNRAVPIWRQSCFAAGLVVLLIADSPWLGSIAEEIVLAHMAQHLLIGDLAALLVVLGLTGPLLQPVLALRGLRWTCWFGNPLIALPIWAFNLYLWHLGALYQGVLDSPGLHLAQHLAFLSFGVVMWMPLLGPLPTPQWFNFGGRLLYLIGVRFCGAVLGNVLSWTGTPPLCRLCSRRGALGSLTIGRPGCGRGADDGRGGSGDARRLCLALPALGDPR